MWPSIPAFRSFGNVACPSGAACELPYCIFSHDVTKLQDANSGTASNTAILDQGPEAKRLKLDNGTKQPAQQATQASSQQAKPQVFVGSITSKEGSALPKNASEPTISTEKTSVNSRTSEYLPRTVTKPVSPPPKKSEANAPLKPEAEVRLTPRKLQKEPAVFTRRLTMLKALHQYMVPLNDKVAKAVRPETKALHLSPNQLNKLVVDEEEKLAKDHTSVYDNVLKQRLVALKKMTVDEWVKSRREAVAKGKGEAPKKPPPKRVDTGLNPKEEVTLLSTLISPQTGLDAHGYVTKLPTDAELNETHAAQELADFWEVCDRCGTRFQVFPDRREEDGALTTGGQCKHHWGKRIFPKKAKGQAPEPTRFSCCNEPVGSPGCTTHDTHVYKISEVKRLSLVMPFVETPENDEAQPHTAVCFDCEMGYTTHGLELLRLTVVSWPTHRPLVDVLVRPLGHILDVNTRFSGVTAEQFVNAKPYDPENPKPIRTDLRIVDSPYVARDLFLSHISPTTPLLGHALENDLNSIRLIHPTIIDTVILYPTRSGLPYRHGLKTLAKWHLGMDIQQAGAAGHDSFEDARTTGELVRFKIAEKWRKLKDEGWTIRDDGVYPPVPPGLPPPTAPPALSMVPLLKSTEMEAHPAEKRKLRQLEEDEGTGSDEPPRKKQERDLKVLQDE
ncbi:hypothetical protein BU26DRAFT_453941 [Trematosphaeria pertusa]|uniref:Exonuclease domain-containing protein n=1 Tax=Trematosphaeria pertusa TaxID=390896 RepID=A0A6A6IJV9_9PLEO|nr:uncharacterized protein BU26DRAFT_453941 [Trematosphaeria pertusa]KAF2250885.1 hypothetical protein BU26DRAFT_453941 [Trematosphaeria pertusa]